MINMIKDKKTIVGISVEEVRANDTNKKSSEESLKVNMEMAGLAKLLMKTVKK
jgi:hypothetical protein